MYMLHHRDQEGEYQSHMVGDQLLQKNHSVREVCLLLLPIGLV